MSGWCLAGSNMAFPARLRTSTSSTTSSSKGRPSRNGPSSPFRTSGLGGADLATELGTPRAQGLDRSRQRTRADIHDGPEHKPLQSEAGYIDARPQSRQIDETSCDARPDHTCGSVRDIPRLREICYNV